MGWTCVLAAQNKPFFFLAFSLLLPFRKFKIKKMRELRLFFSLLGFAIFSSSPGVVLVFIISSEMHKVFHKSCLLDLFVAKGRGEWMERDRKRDGNREAKEESEKVFPAVRWDFPGVLALLAPRFDCVMLDFALLFPVTCPCPCPCPTFGVLFFSLT